MAVGTRAPIPEHISNCSQSIVDVSQLNHCVLVGSVRFDQEIARETEADRRLLWLLLIAYIHEVHRCLQHQYVPGSALALGVGWRNVASDVRSIVCRSIRATGRIFFQTDFL